MESAVEVAREGVAAMVKGEYAAAVTLFLESIKAYPHPTTLRRLGICLLLDRRPADSVLYLAASVELSNKSRRTRSSLLLAKALLTAGNEAQCTRLLKNGIEFFPEVISGRIVEAFRDGWKRADLHRLTDELLTLIPTSHDTVEAKIDPPVNYSRLLHIYNLRKADSTYDSAT
jgi:hypothetical protein